MKKKLFTAVIAGVMMMAMSMTALAAGWQKNDTGWWWQRSNGSYPTGEWKWIDGNADGIVECYYFDANGYMLADTTTPDGYTVNADGAWIVDGVIQRRAAHPEIGDEVVAAAGTTAADVSGAVTDGSTVAQITLNSELVDKIGKKDSLNDFPDRQVIGERSLGPVYTATYRGSSIKIESEKNNSVNTFTGIASQLFNNIPEQGIEMNAFYDNTGYISYSSGRNVMASSGRSDEIFDLAVGSYRMAWFDIGERFVMIVVTQGSDGDWYIYPNSQAFMN